MLGFCLFLKHSLAVGALTVLLRGLVLYGVTAVAVGKQFLFEKLVLGDTYLQNARQRQHFRGTVRKYVDFYNKLCFVFVFLLLASPARYGSQNASHVVGKQIFGVSCWGHLVRVTLG